MLITQKWRLARRRKRIKTAVPQTLLERSLTKAQRHCYGLKIKPRTHGERAPTIERDAYARDDITSTVDITIEIMVNHNTMCHLVFFGPEQ